MTGVKLSLATNQISVKVTQAPKTRQRQEMPAKNQKKDFVVIFLKPSPKGKNKPEQLVFFCLLLATTRSLSDKENFRTPSSNKGLFKFVVCKELGVNC